jgi:hypothetical protein
MGATGASIGGLPPEWLGLLSYTKMPTHFSSWGLTSFLLRLALNHGLPISTFWVAGNSCHFQFREVLVRVCYVTNKHTQKNPLPWFNSTTTEWKKKKLISSALPLELLTEAHCVSICGVRVTGAQKPRCGHTPGFTWASLQASTWGLLPSCSLRVIVESFYFKLSQVLAEMWIRSLSPSATFHNSWSIGLR